MGKDGENVYSLTAWQVVVEGCLLLLGEIGHHSFSRPCYLYPETTQTLSPVSHSPSTVHFLSWCIFSTNRALITPETWRLVALLQIRSLLTVVLCLEGGGVFALPAVSEFSQMVCTNIYILFRVFSTKVCSHKNDFKLNTGCVTSTLYSMQHWDKS